MSGIASVAIAVILRATGMSSLPVWSFGAIGLICFAVACFQAWRDEHGKYTKAVTELEKVQNRRPNIEFVKVTSGQATIHDGVHIFGSPYFFHVAFANIPHRTDQRVKGEKVVGHVSFWNNSHRCVLPERIHRWRGAQSPLEVGKQADLYGQFDLEANELAHGLDMVFKYPEDINCHTHNNDTGLSMKYLDWRDPDWSLGEGSFIAEVRLVGNNVHKTFRFQLKNGGKDMEPIITPISSTDWMDAERG